MTTHKMQLFSNTVTYLDTSHKYIIDSLIWFMMCSSSGIKKCTGLKVVTKFLPSVISLKLKSENILRDFLFYSIKYRSGYFIFWPFQQYGEFSYFNKYELICSLSPVAISKSVLTIRKPDLVFLSLWPIFSAF